MADKKTKISAATYNEYLKRILKEEFEYCRRHVVYWANNYCVIEDKDSPQVIIPFKGWDAQNAVLRDFENYRLNLILKARQMGITWLALYYCTHDLIFNLGHTVGHAIEKCSRFAVSHGRAVAIGTAIMARAFSRDAAEIVSTLRAFGLPTETDFSAEELAEAALADKKRSGETLTLVIPERVGEPLLKKIPVGELPAVIKAGL